MPTDPTQDAHATAHAALTDPTRSPNARQWALVNHLREGHDLDAFGDLPSDPQARGRLHDELHQDDKVSLDPDPAPLLTVVERAHSRMEHADPEDHPDIAAVVVAALFDRMADDGRPAVAVAAVNTASVMLTGSLDRLEAVDPSSYAPALRQAVAALAGRLRDGDVRDQEGSPVMTNVATRAPAASVILARLAVVEPVHLDDEGEWTCAYCHGLDRRGPFTGGARTGWREGEFIVGHEPGCCWAEAAEWLIGGDGEPGGDQPGKER